MRTPPSRRTRIICALVALPLAGLAATAGTGTAAAVAPAVQRQLSHQHAAPAVALGDSYAAGEGLLPYQPGTDTTGNRCHRSDQAYPALLEAAPTRRFSSVVSVACSGATTGDIVADLGQPAQVAALSRRTRTVTLTVGGNDAGFAVVLADCIYTPLPQAQALVPGRPGCRSRQDDLVTDRIAHLAGRADTTAQFPGTSTLPRVLAAIHRRAPQAQVYVTGYPRLFGRTFPSATDGCPVGQLGQVPLFVTADDARWIRRKAGAVNAALAASVARARRHGVRARYVDVAGAFRGHNVCGSGTPWVNGVVVTLPTSPTGVPSIASASFHPNAAGQQAYAAALRRAVHDRRPRG